MYVKDIQPIVKVLTQFSASHSFIWDFVRSGQDTHVHRGLNFAAQAAKLVIFEYTQQLGLRGYGHLADLIQQQGSAFCQLKAAGASLQRARKSSLLMAEDFTLDQSLRDGGAVDRHEGFISAGTEFMNGAGDEFFAGSTGASYEHGCGTRRHHFDQVKNLLHLF